MAGLLFAGMMRGRLELGPGGGRRPTLRFASLETPTFCGSRVVLRWTGWRLCNAWNLIQLHDGFSESSIGTVGPSFERLEGQYSACWRETQEIGSAERMNLHMLSSVIPRMNSTNYICKRVASERPHDFGANKWNTIFALPYWNIPSFDEPSLPIRMSKPGVAEGATQAFDDSFMCLERWM